LLRDGRSIRKGSYHAKNALEAAVIAQIDCCNQLNRPFVTAHKLLVTNSAATENVMRM
jgi:hypothetical protein